jgi:hypothetical protein
MAGFPTPLDKGKASARGGEAMAQAVVVVFLIQQMV